MFSAVRYQLLPDRPVSKKQPPPYAVQLQRRGVRYKEQTGKQPFAYSRSVAYATKAKLGEGRMPSVAYAHVQKASGRLNIRREHGRAKYPIDYVSCQEKSKLGSGVSLHNEVWRPDFNHAILGAWKENSCARAIPSHSPINSGHSNGNCRRFR